MDGNWLKTCNARLPEPRKAGEPYPADDPDPNLISISCGGLTTYKTVRLPSCDTEVI